MDEDSLDLRDNELDEVASQSVVFDEGSESLFGREHQLWYLRAEGGGTRAGSWGSPSGSLISLLR